MRRNVGCRRNGRTRAKRRQRIARAASTTNASPRSLKIRERRIKPRFHSPFITQHRQATGCHLNAARTGGHCLPPELQGALPMHLRRIRFHQTRTLAVAATSTVLFPFIALHSKLYYHYISRSPVSCQLFIPRESNRTGTIETSISTIVRPTLSASKDAERQSQNIKIKHSSEKAAENTAHTRE